EPWTATSARRVSDPLPLSDSKPPRRSRYRMPRPPKPGKGRRRMPNVQGRRGSLPNPRKKTDRGSAVKVGSGIEEKTPPERRRSRRRLQPSCQPRGGD
ncbi:hypothetical protein PHMEG_00039914, partial [Phytophthora megakarya]